MTALVGRGVTGAGKFACYRYNGGSDLSLVHHKACPPKLPERRRDGGTCTRKASNYVWRPRNLVLAFCERCKPTMLRRVINGSLQRNDLPERGCLLCCPLGKTWGGFLAFHRRLWCAKSIPCALASVSLLLAGYLAAGCGYEADGPYYPGSPLVEAAENGDAARVEELLVRDPGLAAEPDEGTRALFYGLRHPKVVDILTRHGADVNARTQGGESPLHHAAQQGYVESAELLIANGADVKSQDDYGWVPLHWAAARGSVEMVRSLLEAGADPNASSQPGGTPLHCAAWKGYVSVAEILLSYGADPNKTNPEGLTPEQWSREWGLRDFADFLASKR